MGWILLVLYVVAVVSLAVGIYNYITLQELTKANKFNSNYLRKIDSKVGNIEKITDNKKWTWK